MNTMNPLRIAGLLLLGLAPTAHPEIVNVPRDAAQKWLRHVLPLPHEVAIPRKAVLRPEGVSIRLRDNAGEVEKNAARELEEFFKQKTGTVPAGKDFEIAIGILDADGRASGVSVENWQRLKGLPNPDQAYLIRPAGDNRLLLTAIHEKGVYYAEVTLRQLLEPVTTKDRTEIPLVSVTDWPDTEERGLWNCSSLVIDLTPATKFNFSRSPSLLGAVKRGEPNHAALRENEFKRGRPRAIHCLPDITHLNFLHYHSLYDAYPELKGKGDRAIAGQYPAHIAPGKTVENRVPCASNPVLTDTLGEWLMDVASQGAPECACWLSERPAQCECEKCLPVGQFVLESRAFVNAWKKVREKFPAFNIRIFISTTTNEKYDKVLEELPAGVKVERACALGLERKRHEPRDVYTSDVIDPCAAKGLWAATYDVPVTANGKVDTPEINLPFSSAHRIRDFIRQMAARRYRGMYGMLDGGVIPEFNVDAVAEWTWNLDGRNEREFAASWATRRGYADPDTVAEWAELMGPVEWDVYDSGFPECYTWGRAATMIKERRKPTLGHGMFRYYADRDSFDAKIAVCEKALALAKDIQPPHLANETRVILSYIKLAKSVYQIAEGISSAETLSPELKGRLKKFLDDLRNAGDENVAAIKAWRSAVSPEPWHRRVTRAIDATQSTVQEIAQVLAKAGVEDP
jgi:hypothetical protein